jgi:hypothetical protein
MAEILTAGWVKNIKLLVNAEQEHEHIFEAAASRSSASTIDQDQLLEPSRQLLKSIEASLILSELFFEVKGGHGRATE